MTPNIPGSHEQPAPASRRWRWSLRVRTFVFISVVLAIAIGSTVVAMSLNARDTLLQQVERDVNVLARVLARSISVSQQLPDQMEELMGQGMQATATALAHYVVAAEKSGESREGIRAVLKRIIDSTMIGEIWITDSKGHAYLNAPLKTDFTFSPDARLQPQASAFWDLLSGRLPMVNQPMQPREIDKKLFKYVGVGGVDKPRIVQVGTEGAPVQAMREFAGVKRLAGLLVETGSLKAMYVVNQEMDTVAYREATQTAEGSSVQEKDQLARVMASGEVLTRIHADHVEVTRQIRDEYDNPLGAFSVQLPRDGFDNLLQQQLIHALTVGGFVFVLAGIVSLWFADRITQPIAAITRAAGKVKAGQFTQLVELQTPSLRDDEIGQLSQVFESMASVVGNRERELDRLVTERTHELAHKNQALEVAQQRIDEELELARKLQLAILPARFPANDRCTGDARMLPATSMGGDFYDFIDLGQGRIAVVMADVSGKGVAAAFFMAVARTSINSLIRKHDDPGVCLHLANNELCAQNPLDLFVTVFVGILDTTSGELTYANAGHNPPYTVGLQGQARQLPSTQGLALGVMPDMDYATQTMRLRSGDLLLAYTDGVTEAFNAEQQAFGEGRLEALLCAHFERTPHALVKEVFQQLSAFAGQAPQSDDITVAALRWVDASTVS
jgi:sigma-B regulation protein RsbU (phosphoserine phosphatase)